MLLERINKIDNPLATDKENKDANNYNQKS